MAENTKTEEGAKIIVKTRNVIVLEKKVAKVGSKTWAIILPYEMSPMWEELHKNKKVLRVTIEWQ